MKRFPEGFMWGVATSAYQIEGSADADGKGESIWDRFARERLEENGDVACDHYRRWRDDVELLGELGVNAYRFSISWPRLFPDGRGEREQRGFDHYDRLIAALLERGITPVVTLYHWDLPQALEENGGWRSRDTVERFAEYAAACFDAYGDRVDWWCTINEPWIIGLLGYLHGLHAPGHKDDVRGEATAFHHTLLAHGRAVQALRASGHDGGAGLAFCLAPHQPASSDDVDVSRLSDGYVNRWFLDPVLRGSYPDDMRALWESRIGPLDFVQDGDLETIATPSDFVGINYYSRRVIRSDPDAQPWPWEVVVGDAAQTEAGTEVVPESFTELLVRVRDDYGDVPILITENGAVYEDHLHDERRLRFLRDHLEAVHDAIEQGVNVVGYCHWSFMDNFEWALGYAQRFGLVHVDYETQERTIKDSGREYARIARANAL